MEVAQQAGSLLLGEFVCRAGFVGSPRAIDRSGLACLTNVPWGVALVA